MKQILKQLIENELTKNNALLSVNSISDDDRAIVESAIQSLTETLQAVDDMPENDNSMVDELKQAVADLQESLTAIKERMNQNQSEKKIETEEMENYLSTKNSIRDFANVIRNSKSIDEFRNGWNSVLTTNGITIEEGSELAYLPQPVLGRIQDIWDRNADWLRDLRNTGAKSYFVRVNTTDQDLEEARAKGWKQGDTKVAQQLTFAAKKVEAQFIYKLQEIDLKTKWDSDEDLINYVIDELVDQILYEEKRAILVGDGRDDSSDYKITSFETIMKDTEDIYTNVIEAEEDSFMIDNMVELVDSLHNPDGRRVFVFMNKADLRSLRRVAASDSSTPVYLPVEQVAETIGASRIITTDLLEEGTAIAMIPEKYCLVGANIFSPEFMNFHDIYQNLDVYRMEIVAGGAIEGLKSTAVLLPAGE